MDRNLPLITVHANFPGTTCSTAIVPDTSDPNREFILMILYGRACGEHSVIGHLPHDEECFIGTYAELCERVIELKYRLKHKWVIAEDMLGRGYCFPLNWKDREVDENLYF